jgi:hypothetical protein
MFIPYSVLFAAGCVASLVSCMVKFNLLVRKWRSRNVKPGQSGRFRKFSVGGVKISPELIKQESDHEAMTSLQDRFDVHQLERYKSYCYLMVAIAEDIPLGTCSYPRTVSPANATQLLHVGCMTSPCGVEGAMNTVYMLWTIQECVETFRSESQRVCDLDASSTLVLLLSMPAIAPLCGHSTLVSIARGLHGRISAFVSMQARSRPGPRSATSWLRRRPSSGKWTSTSN